MPPAQFDAGIVTERQPRWHLPTCLLIIDDNCIEWLSEFNRYLQSCIAVKVWNKEKKTGYCGD